ncbi:MULTISPECIES: nucleotide exchange factor GrpE [Streptomyces]|uniref:Nucleotide exchange factor GrpE n=2 Tax=Streptomyces TaxID=1883 RepID=A0ABU4KAE4_9ACTN|nr:nucleotide exchange factor GrpE [Streptomyces roseolus]MDX2294529.1 nucleotide exchange factor GrpE [Streptomyces roseolus]
MTGPGPLPAEAGGPPSELDRLRRRVAALSEKRDEAEARLHALLGALLSLDDVLADTRLRAGVLHEARSARETASAALALGEQIDAAHLMLRAEFERHDVSPMEVVGRAVDPAEMRVVGTEPDPDRPGGTVLRETLTGFRRGPVTLRAAQVVVSVPGPAPVPAPDPVPEAGGTAEPVPGAGAAPDPVPATGPATKPVPETGPATEPVPETGPAAEPVSDSVAESGAAAEPVRAQPRRTSRAQRRLLRKPSVRRTRRPRRPRRTD